VPPLQKPSVPSAPSAPKPQLPSLRSPQETTGRIGGATTGATGGAVGGEGNGAPAGEVASAPGLSAGPTGGDEQASSGSDAQAASRGGRSRGAEPDRQRSRAVRRFRRAVRKLQGCFYAISGLERRVLSLRAGLGANPLSPRAVAKRLRLSTTRVLRVERKGLRGLRAADKSDGCGRATSLGLRGDEGAETVVAAAGSGPRLASLGALDKTSTTADANAPGVGRREVLGAHRSSGSTRRSRLAGATAEPPDNGAGLLIAGIFAALLLLSALAILLIRRPRAGYEAASLSATVSPPPWESRQTTPSQFEVPQEEAEPRPGELPELEQAIAAAHEALAEVQFKPAERGPEAEPQSQQLPPPEHSAHRGGGVRAALVASGLASLLLGRVLGRRLRRRR
jgi:hypothetical protein